MYADHVPLLRAHGSKPDGFADLITFALLTIRQPFTRMPFQWREVRRLSLMAPSLFGFKRDGYEYAQEHKARLCGALAATVDAEGAIAIIGEVPCLGFVKSAFVAQMLGYDVACFDSRNAAKFGLTARPFRSDGRKLSPRRIASYVHMTRETGGAEFWWNDWCNRVAADRGYTPQKISAIHLEVLQ